MTKKDSILLVGANGQVGFEIGRSAERLGLPMVSLGRGQLDITDSLAVTEIFAGLRPRLVINGAAYTAVDKAESDRENVFLVNHLGVANLASACAAREIPLVHLSTDYIFNGTKKSPYQEGDQAEPSGLYSLSKWRGEEAVRRILKKHLIIRVSWVFGSHGQNFVKTMLRLGRDREVLKVVADQHGCPTYAGHIAETLLDMVKQISARQFDDRWGTYHYCGEPATTWHGFAEEIFRQANRKGLINHPVVVEPIGTTDYPTAARRPENSVLDCSKIREGFGLNPGNWQAGLAEMLDLITLE